MTDFSSVREFTSKFKVEKYVSVMYEKVPGVNSIKAHFNTKNRLLSAQLRHTASSSQTEEEGREGREPVGEM